MQPPVSPAASNSATRMPSDWHAYAHASPDMPPPTIATSIAPSPTQRRLHQVCQTADERRVAFHRAGAYELGDAHVAGDSAILDVDLVERLDMFRHKGDR